jgi:hypothetical protein
MSTVTTIKQRSITIELESRKITVRRMRWAAARTFLKKLAGHIAKLGTSLNDALAKLPELIAGADELAVELVVNSTDLAAEDFDKLDVAEAAAVLAAAVELNLGEDLKNSFAGIAANLGALKPATKTSAGEEPTPS